MKSPKKPFLYDSKNPNSYNIFTDNNPKDTISIKYNNLESLRNTINKLEKLYKSGSYTHKRISQVGMIIKVRLKIIYDKSNTLYKKSTDIVERYKLSNKYFEFLKQRTKEKNDTDRKLLTFIG